MREFFKFMFASMLGTFLTLVIIFFLSLGVLFIIVSIASSEEVNISKNTILQITLDEPIPDRTPKSPFFMEQGKKIGLFDILKNIKKAKTDENIRAIYLDISYIPTGLATIDEIRNALLDFKSSGKPVFCYSEYYTQPAYYLASVSDKIYLHPEGMMLFKGINARMLFLKGTLDKLDIKMQVIRHGKYKAATEPLFLDKMSAENREQVNSLIANSWNTMLKGIASGRGIQEEKLNRMADSLTAQIPGDALKARLVDQLAYKDEFVKDVKHVLNLPEKNELSLITLDKYMNTIEKTKKRTLEKNKIAIIYTSGDIVEGNGDEESIGSEKISKTIRKAREDSKIKAIVLRINSPGGGSLASDVIWREVMLAAKEKPVVASFGNVAASGGYYIACPATKIFADPATITGSIGVFAVIPDLKGFFNNKLGITFDNAKTNANSDFIPVTNPLSDYQAMKLQSAVEKTYASFISKVAQGRHMTVAGIDSIGQGRVWSATDAKRIGLIDDFGGMDKAVEAAAKLAKITEWRLVSLPEQKDPIQDLFDRLTGNNSSSILEKELGENYKYFRYIKEIQDMKGIQSRMPFEIILN